MPSNRRRVTRRPRTPGLAPVVERNTQALLARREEEERDRSLQDRTADVVTRFAGTMLFIYLHLLGFGLWIFINLGWLSVEPFDPSFMCWRWPLRSRRSSSQPLC